MAERNTARRDLLLQLQAEAQAKWEQAAVFQEDAPAGVVSSPANKFFGNFPYPYMNGLLHLGHAFSLSKLEFTSAYQRMQGKHVLFPFGFHCTGMPIKAAADKLDREFSTYGCPPQFPAPVEVEEGAPPAGDDPATFKAKKSKVAAKTGGEVRQWNILKSSGIPEGELQAFRDPVHWLNYFPPLGKRDISSMGCGVDWRRSFITTDKNPYYDAFVRCHMNSLYN
jgi:leucyl-tRNA synthetase